MHLRQRKEERSQNCYLRYLRDKVDHRGFKKMFISKSIGFGVVTTKHFKKGDFLLEYAGQLITATEGKKRDVQYEQQGYGCYLFYFTYNSKRFCLDATLSTKLGRFVNDSMDGNCQMRQIVFDGVPHLALFALRDIDKGSELRYDYGDNTNLWWRYKDTVSTSTKSRKIQKETSASTLDETRIYGEVKLSFCHLCPRKFTLPQNRKRHIEECHSGKKRNGVPTSCSHCGRRMANNSSLRRHFVRFHVQRS